MLSVVDNTAVPWEDFERLSMGLHAPFEKSAGAPSPERNISKVGRKEAIAKPAWEEVQEPERLRPWPRPHVLAQQLQHQQQQQDQQESVALPVHQQQRWHRSQQQAPRRQDQECKWERGPQPLLAERPERYHRWHSDSHRELKDGHRDLDRERWRTSEAADRQERQHRWSRPLEGDDPRSSYSPRREDFTAGEPQPQVRGVGVCFPGPRRKSSMEELSSSGVPQTPELSEEDDESGTLTSAGTLVYDFFSGFFASPEPPQPRHRANISTSGAQVR